MILLQLGKVILNGIRKQLLQGCESYRRNADGVQGFKTLDILEEIQKFKGRSTVCTRALQKARSSSCQCTMALYGKQQKTKSNVNTVHRQLRIMLANWSLVILGAWIRRNMVRNIFSQTRRILGPNGCRNVGKFLSIRSSDISCLHRFCERRITKQRRGERSQHINGSNETHRVAFPHRDFCESAEYLRSNSRFWRRSTQTYLGSAETCST